MIKEIKFTDKALEHINTLLSKKDKGSFFRIAIKGGGCSGFQYEFTFDTALETLFTYTTDSDGDATRPLGEFPVKE